MAETRWYLDPDRFFSPEPLQRTLARNLYQLVADLPIVSPHGHVDPRLFVDENARFGTPTELFIIPDHYVYRMLYSHGVPLESLGIPSRDGSPVESDHRKIWQIFAEHFYLFRGTPSGIWLKQELIEVFGIEEKLTAASAQRIYDRIMEQLDSPAFRPRVLYERFNIETLCTTDAVTTDLPHHRAIKESGWQGDIRPTYRADALFDVSSPNWLDHLKALEVVSGKNVTSFQAFLQALEQQRQLFKRFGATATDQAALTAFTEALSPTEAERIFQRALRGEVSSADAMKFMGHMLMESARMSVEDGMVMQLHIGSLRNYDRAVYARFGADKGFDIPVQSEFTNNLRPLLEKFGSHPNFTLIVFTLDESTLSRELAPLAGVYPALKLGPPWWFFDSINGINRYFDLVMETAGIYNSAGFNDDTRAFPSIPARHDVWRRLSANWVAGLVVRGIVDELDASEMVVDLVYRLPRQVYRLDAESRD